MHGQVIHAKHSINNAKERRVKADLRYFLVYNEPICVSEHAKTGTHADRKPLLVLTIFNSFNEPSTGTYCHACTAEFSNINTVHCQKTYQQKKKKN